ncbi:MAG TPA: alpha/beta hydrolase domain-containing protein [Pirellulaceae bacterium]|nr:alpha/beta hydrolase domain-containing protein [Pirellulaceae bacterium]
MLRTLVATILSLILTGPLAAEVTRWEITKREPYADGKLMGDRGAYEKWTGKVHFALDSVAEANQQIVDLALAPANDAGKVEFWAEFEMLVPVDPSKANGALFYEVNNRGNKTAPNMFDTGADEFLCRQGFVVLWSGWIAEILPDDNRLNMRAPVALLNNRPVRGIVRQEVIVEKLTPRVSLAHRGIQGSYRPIGRTGRFGTLTMRERQADARQNVPRNQWQLLVRDVYDGDRLWPLPIVELEVEGGLKPGWIYEVVYQAEGSVVQGVGLAGIRDIVSALKFGGSPETNPLLNEEKKPLVDRTIGFGTSQSGRCLRHFLWEGFNADEQGRKVFDGVISHVAGGGLGSFNHRFASPTRTNGQHDEHLFPADFFPFTYGDEKDPFSGKTDGILARARKTNTVPKVFHTQSSSEYWHRSGSLVHTDPQANRDSEIPTEVRLYTFGGTQHGPGSGTPAAKGGGKLPSNPADYRPLLRGLLLALDAWVKEGKEPPPSVYPRIADQTLVGWKKEESGWPDVPAVDYPTVIQQPPFLFRGDDWESKRIATIEPPQIKGHYIVKVPAIGPDGNEQGTLNLPAISVPVASYTSWNLRDARIGAEGELLSLQGGYVPFARTKSEREAAKDPRPSLAERYQDYQDYENRYRAAAERLIAERFVLQEELPRLKGLCEKFRSAFGTPLKAVELGDSQGGSKP